MDKLTETDTLYRCEHALELWRTGEYDYLVTSGGIFHPPNVQSVPAGTLMGLWFLEHGVPERQILCEDTSLDTYENIAHSIAMLKALDVWPSCQITVVTQWQHAIRFFITFLWAWWKPTRLCSLDQPITWGTWLQEWVLIAYHILDRKGTGWVACWNRDRRRQKK